MSPSNSSRSVTILFYVLFDSAALKANLNPVSLSMNSVCSGLTERQFHVRTKSEKMEDIALRRKVCAELI